MDVFEDTNIYIFIIFGIIILFTVIFYLIYKLRHLYRYELIRCNDDTNFHPAEECTNLLKK